MSIHPQLIDEAAALLPAAEREAARLEETGAEPGIVQSIRDSVIDIARQVAGMRYRHLDKAMKGEQVTGHKYHSRQWDAANSRWLYDYGDSQRHVVARHEETPEERAPADNAASDTKGGSGFTVAHERDWTWVSFPNKPAPAVLDALRSMGARWGGKRKAWYINRHITHEDLQKRLGVAGGAAGDVSGPTRYQTSPRKTHLDWDGIRALPDDELARQVKQAVEGRHTDANALQSEALRRERMQTDRSWSPLQPHPAPAQTTPHDEHEVALRAAGFESDNPHKLAGRIAQNYVRAHARYGALLEKVKQGLKPEDYVKDFGSAYYAQDVDPEPPDPGADYADIGTRHTNKVAAVGHVALHTEKKLKSYRATLPVVAGKFADLPHDVAHSVSDGLLAGSDSPVYRDAGRMEQNHQARVQKEAARHAAIEANTARIRAQAQREAEERQSRVDEDQKRAKADKPIFGQITSTTHGPEAEVIKRMQNPKKQTYAIAYAAYLRTGGREPDHGDYGISQAVAEGVQSKLGAVIPAHEVKGRSKHARRGLEAQQSGGFHRDYINREAEKNDRRGLYDDAGEQETNEPEPQEQPAPQQQGKGTRGEPGTRGADGIRRDSRGRNIDHPEYEPTNVPEEFDDGAGGDLRDYPVSDVQHDHDMMRQDFGDDDKDVQRYKKVLDHHAAKGKQDQQAPETESESGDPRDVPNRKQPYADAAYSAMGAFINTLKTDAERDLATVFLEQHQNPESRRKLPPAGSVPPKREQAIITKLNAIWKQHKNKYDAPTKPGNKEAPTVASTLAAARNRPEEPDTSYIPKHPDEGGGADPAPEPETRKPSKQRRDALKDRKREGAAYSDSELKGLRTKTPLPGDTENKQRLQSYNSPPDRDQEPEKQAAPAAGNDVPWAPQARAEVAAHLKTKLRGSSRAYGEAYAKQYEGKLANSDALDDAARGLSGAKLGEIRRDIQAIWNKHEDAHEAGQGNQQNNQPAPVKPSNPHPAPKSREDWDKLPVPSKWDEPSHYPGYGEEPYTHQQAANRLNIDSGKLKEHVTAGRIAASQKNKGGQAGYTNADLQSFIDKTGHDPHHEGTPQQRVERSKQERGRQQGQAEIDQETHDIARKLAAKNTDAELQERLKLYPKRTQPEMHAIIQEEIARRAGKAPAQDSIRNMSDAQLFKMIEMADQRGMTSHARELRAELQRRHPNGLANQEQPKDKPAFGQVAPRVRRPAPKKAEPKSGQRSIFDEDDGPVQHGFAFSRGATTVKHFLAKARNAEHNRTIHDLHRTDRAHSDERSIDLLVRLRHAEADARSLSGKPLRKAQQSIHLLRSELFSLDAADE